MATAAQKRVAIVVLGDLARSPRMQYHARALVAAGAHVDLVAYGALPGPAEGHITVHSLAEPSWLQRSRWPAWMFLPIAALRALHQAVQLWWTLRVRLPLFETLLVQVPPALPTLLLARRAASARGARLIIDWHNFGYAMLGLRLGNQPLVRLMRRLEHACGRRADASLCVSTAMQRQLAEQWGIAATVLHDRPPHFTPPLDVQRKRDLLAKYPALLPDYRAEDARRPALLISPTSWTADEDFDCLCAAAVEYDGRAAAAGDLPKLLLLITGKGDLQSHYESRFAQLQLQHVEWRTAWLPQSDYMLVLSSGDLGVCMHRSASGVDLPMKVADMLGAGLPVCMLDYGPCVREMIDDQRTGVLFRTATELANLWVELLRGFPQLTPRLAALRAQVAAEDELTWESNWRTTARPLFE